jgi:dienelactone hydrolase
MIKEIIITYIIAFCSTKLVQAQNQITPDTVSVLSGELTLKALLWRPAGKGPFPTIIFCHGSLGGSDTIHNPVHEISLLGPVFATRGYLFLGLFRRGAALSQGQGVNSTVVMEEAYKAKGQEERNKVQLQQLETDQLKDMIAGLQFLRRRKDVDTNLMAIVAHSFGGSLALIVSERDPGLKAAVIFSPAGYSWDRSSQLRNRLTSAVKNINAPVMIIHAQNDYSVNPGYVLDSIRNKLDKPHLLKIYPKFGNSPVDAHGLIFLSIKTWENDVFGFLNKSLYH